MNCFHVYISLFFPFKKYDIMKKLLLLKYSILSFFIILFLNSFSQTSTKIDEPAPENFYITPIGMATWDHINNDDLQFYKIWLDDIFIADVDTNFYQYNEEYLVSGESYLAEIQAEYSNGLSEKVSFEFTYFACDYFPSHSYVNAEMIENTDNLLITWIEPTTQGKENNELNSIGTNIYVDDEIIAFIPEPDTFYIIEEIPSGFYTYCITKVYTEDDGAHSWTSCLHSTCIEDAGSPEECYAPVNLVVYRSTENDNVFLYWDSGSPPVSEWLFYDIALSFGMMPGLSTDYSIMRAVKFVPEDLTPYTTGYVTQVAIYKDGLDDEVTEIRILSGDGYNTLYTQDITGTLVDNWNQITLDNPVPFDNSENLWIALYSERPGGSGVSPVGGVEEILLDRYDYYAFNDEDWTTVYNTYGISNGAWMLRAFVSTSEDGENTILSHLGNESHNIANNSKTPNFKNSDALLGYNVIRDGELINEEIITSTYYTDIYALGEYCYEVIEVRSQCQSEPSNIACVLGPWSTNGLLNTQIKVYPNPILDVLNIESSDKITSITILNHLGQIIYTDFSASSEHSQINTSHLNSGLYFIEIKSATKTEKTKIIIQ